MKIVIILLYVLFIFNFTKTYRGLAIIENCSSSTYYNLNADICGKHSLYLYPGKKYDFPDYWVGKQGDDKKERILQASTSKIELVNFNSTDYKIIYTKSEFSSNWISAEADTYGYTGKKPVIGWLYGLGLDSNQDTSKLDKTKPVARIDRKIVNFKVDITGDITPPISDYKYCTVDESTKSNGESIYSGCNFVSSPGPKKTKSTFKGEHLESYLLYPAWCGDGVVSHGENCDPNDTSKLGWGDLGCSATCTPVNSTLPGGGGSCVSGGVTGVQTSPITQTTPNLCPNGQTVSNFTSNTSGNTTNYTWSCNGYNGGNCNASYTNSTPPSGSSSSCGDGFITGSETCETHQFFTVARMCTGQDGVSYDCSYQELRYDPTHSGCRSLTCNYCGDGNLDNFSRTGEMCDFGTGTWPHWCRQSDCKILENSTPSGGDIQISPLGDLLIGHNMSVFGNLPGSKISIKNNSLSDIYIDKKLCAFKDDVYNSLSGQINICSLNEVGRLNKSGGFKEYTISPTVWKGNTNNFLSSIKFTDNKIITKIEGVPDTSFLAAILNVRVAKSTLDTISGGASFLDGDDLSDVNQLSNGFGLLRQPKNKNFILTSMGINPLSSFVKSTSNSGILNIGKNDENAYLNNLSSLNTRGTISLTIYSLPTSKYNNLDNVFIHNGDVTLNSQTISGNKTYIINGKLTINGNINSSDNVLFVVKSGDLIIDSSVTKIDAILINIGGDVQSSGTTLNRLTINGALYGNISNLIANRTYIKDRGEYVDVGTNINFTSKIFTNPPPLLSKFLKEFSETQKIPR